MSRREGRPIDPSGLNSATTVFMGTSATTYLMGVDLSDVTNYQHRGVDHAVVYDVRVDCALSGAGVWIVAVGLITENDATDGSVYYFDAFIITHATTPVHRKYLGEWVGGLRCDIDTATNKPKSFLAAFKNLTATFYKNTANLPAPHGGTANPAPGDIVITAYKLAGAGTLVGTLNILYNGAGESNG